MSKDKKQLGESSLVKERVRTQKPKMFKVILHNDDFTTMEFVIFILKTFFQKTEDMAYQMMLEVHFQGKTIAGVFTHDVAETKMNQVNELSRKEGHPFLATMEPE